jgi:hypothetical protein
MRLRSRTERLPGGLIKPGFLEEAIMRNLRQRATAVALSVIMCAGMVIFSPTLHAAGPSDRSIEVRCANLARAIAAATAILGPDAELVVYLQGEYAKYCAATAPAAE